jgi:HAD hydrolase, family IA, variant 1
MNKTILFDLDGTLIDSTKAILFGFKKAYEAFGETAPCDEDIKALIGYTLEDIFTKLGAKGDIDGCVKIYKEAYKTAYLQDTVLLSSAFEALSEASKIADVGIVTTKTSRYSADILRNLGVMKFINTVVGRDDVINPKPNPEPINEALKRLGKTSVQDKASAFMIGDTVMDMQAAARAGVAGLGLTCGYGKEFDLRKYSNFIFANALEAVRFIETK